MMKKGQTAMEYLMTYGWAILIVIVVVAALYSMGVFTVSPGVSCSPCFSNFAYVDYADGTLLLTNGPREINITSVTNADLVGGDYQLFDASDSITIENITTTGNIDLTMSYILVSSGLTHSDTATIHN